MEQRSQHATTRAPAVRRTATGILLFAGLSLGGAGAGLAEATTTPDGSAPSTTVADDNAATDTTDASTDATTTPDSSSGTPGTAHRRAGPAPGLAVHHGGPGQPGRWHCVAPPPPRRPTVATAAPAPTPTARPTDATDGTAATPDTTTATTGASGFAAVTPTTEPPTSRRPPRRLGRPPTSRRRRATPPPRPLTAPTTANGDAERPCPPMMGQPGVPGWPEGRGGPTMPGGPGRPGMPGRPGPEGGHHHRLVTTHRWPGGTPDATRRLRALAIVGHFSDTSVREVADVARPGADYRLVTPPVACTAMSDRPLRIAYLTYRGKPHVGGQGVYTRHLTKALVDLGHPVEVFGGQPYPVLDERVPLHQAAQPRHLQRPLPRPLPGLLGAQDHGRLARDRSVHRPARSPSRWRSASAPCASCKPRAGEFDLVHDNQCLGYGILGIERADPDDRHAAPPDHQATAQLEMEPRPELAQAAASSAAGTRS